MLFFILFIFLISIINVNSAPVSRVAVYTSYNVLLSNDVMGCQTDSNNGTNIVVNFYAVPSSGNYVVCVTDELGHGIDNNIEINTAVNTGGQDLFEPGDNIQYIIGSNFKTSCFYSVYDPVTQIGKWVERRF